MINIIAVTEKGVRRKDDGESSPGGRGRFAFEKEDGTADLVSSAELRRFLAGSGGQCVFVSGCQSGKAPREALAGICQGLVGGEVPLAVGWAASIADDLATNFARTFYRTLVCEMQKA